MPEGDTVYRCARQLNRALAGHILLDSDFRLPQLATVDLSGHRVLEVVPRGKHILIRLDDGRTLHSHLMMDGSWRVYPAGARKRGPAHEVRIVLGTEQHQTVGYRLHEVKLVPTSAEADLVGHLGPDLLDRECDLAQAVVRLQSQRDREIGPALLDQRNLAGLGNLYKCEVLFLRGIWPWAPVRDVADVLAMVSLSRRLLWANKNRWEQITTGSARRGEQHWVFERSGRPCRRCGTPVRSAEQDDPPNRRLTYWCPRCQPAS